MCIVISSRETEAYRLLFQMKKHHGAQSEFHANPFPLILSEKQQLKQHNMIWAFCCNDTELI